MMKLPPELQAVLSAAIGMLVAEGLQSLSRLLNKDLSGLQTALAAAIVAVLVAAVDGLLAMIPAEYIQFAEGLMAFLVVVLVPMGLHSLITKFRAPTIELTAVADDCDD
jgi:hypothetical protein